VLIVLDTNVLVSGLLNPFGAPGRVLDLILAGTVQVAFDDRVLAEYAEVLARPRLGTRPARARALLGFLRLSGLRVTAHPMHPGEAHDASDLPFAEVASAAHVDALVTGNARRYAFLEQDRVAALSQAEFLARVA